MTWTSSHCLSCSHDAPSSSVSGVSAAERVDVDDSLGERLRRFLGQVVPDTAGDIPVLVLTGELRRVSTRLRMRRAVRVAFHRDGRNRDDRARGEPFLKIVVLALAIGQTLPPAVVVDRDRDM